MRTSAALAGLATLTMFECVAAMAPAAAQAPVYNWSGFYVGGQAGFGSGQGNASVIPDSRFVNDTGYTGVSTGSKSSFRGGAFAGYNWQTPGGFVYGLDADVMFGRLSSSATNGTSGTFGGGEFGSTFTVVGAVQQRLGTSGAFRGRLGYAFGNVLLYATGGLAIAEVSANGSIITTVTTNDREIPAAAPAATTVFPQAASISGTRLGWTLGAGVDVAFSQNWFVRAEYAYASFGKKSALSNGDPSNESGPPPFLLTSDAKLHTVKIGVGYKF